MGGGGGGWGWGVVDGEGKGKDERGGMGVLSICVGTGSVEVGAVREVEMCALSSRVKGAIA